MAAGPLLPEIEPLRRASRQVVRELGFLAQGASVAGVTYAQCHVLIELESRGEATGGELAAELNLDKSTLSRTVAGLVRAGLVAARDGSGDRRRRPLSLTAAGRRRLAQLHRHANAQVHGALALMSAEDRAVTVKGMQAYARALVRARARETYSTRPVRPADDPAVEGIVRAVLTEFGATGPGFAIHDPEIRAMSRAYRGRRARYWVVERAGEVVGGAGFGPLAGGTPDTCELRKMYFRPEVRGAGMGRTLLLHVLAEARRAGYRSCYLETLESMTAARRLYESVGFVRSKPQGATGHFGCDAWYHRSLEAEAPIIPA